MRSLADFGEPREFELNLPYGKISCMKWGPEKGARFLALHAWQDNLATFFTLVHYLPDNIQLVAIDIVGHGFSSHLPIGAKYSRFQFVLATKRVALALGWKHFSILGHSLGGVIGLLYAGIFPDELESIISIDSIYPGVRPFGEYTLDKCCRVLLMEEENEISPPTYSIDEARFRFRKGRFGLPSSNSDIVRAMLQRSLKKVDGDKVMFLRDSRLRLYGYFVEEIGSPEQILDLIRSIKSKTLLIIAKGVTLTIYDADLQKECRDILVENLKEKLQFVEVDGDHYVHLQNPKEIGRIITEFISTQNIC